MRVADYIANACYGNGIRHVFMVTGGAAMHLNDAFAAHHGLSIHPLHHEQSCSMAADAFARVSNSMALVNVTAGPGGINALNGVFGAYVDSLPMIVVSFSTPSFIRSLSKSESITASQDTLFFS